MIKKLKTLLQGMDGLYGWKIIEVNKEASEVFFVKKTLDMNRYVDTLKVDVTLYVAFEEEGTAYLGQSTAEITPSMTESDILKVLEDVRLGASFVKNKPFELPKPMDGQPEQYVSQFEGSDLLSWMPKLTKAVYQYDTMDAGGINSSEIFLNKRRLRLLNSEGIDVAYTAYDVMVEVVADWNEGKEPVELFTIMTFGDFNPEVIANRVKDLIDESKERAHALPMPELKNVNVILSGEAVKDFLKYFVVRSSARLKYEGISQFEIGQALQGDDIVGDGLNIEMLPVLEGSSKSAPYDQDGMLLKPLKLIENGELKALIGSSQFAHYLGIEPTGYMQNFRVGLGSTSYETMTKEPYIELLSFSHFQMSFLTGDFGGEIRLAKYFDGEQVSYLTSGSLSANIKQVQGALCLSSDEVQIDDYHGPKHILLKGLDVAGA